MKHYLLHLIFLLLLACFVCTTAAQTITIFAGIESADCSNSDNIQATDACLYYPVDVAIDDSGNVYISDLDNSCIRKVDPTGIITTVAGVHGSAGYNGDNIPATSAFLYNPSHVAIDRSHNLYIVDELNNRIRKVDTEGIITTFAGNGTYASLGDGGAASLASLAYPSGITIDGTGNVYISDSSCRVRRIDTAGIINTVAGIGIPGVSPDSGPALTIAIEPRDLAMDSSGNLFINDNNQIRKLSPSGMLYLIAGNGVPGYSGDGGPATGAAFNGTAGMTTDDTGNVYIADEDNNRIRKISPSGIINTVASIGSPFGVAIMRDGSLVIPDGLGLLVYKVAYTDGIKSVLQQNNIKVFPNPNHGDFTINIHTAVALPVSLSVINMLGEKVLQLDETTNKALHIRLNEPPGMYYLQAATAEGITTQKIIID